MNPPFYYADANSQPVGPLSLDEIRRFVAAGVIPPDVLVCEADGETWRPLTGFNGPPRTAPPRTGIPPTARPVSAAPDPGQSARQLGLHFNHAVVAMGAYFLVDIMPAAQGNGGDAGTVGGPLIVIAALWVAVAEAVLIFQLCKSMPPHLFFTTPGRATGFLFIPGFHLFWAFRLFPGLATGALRWKEEESGERLTSGLVSYSYVVAVSLVIGSVVALLQTIKAGPTGAFDLLLMVADYGLRFSYYALLIGQIQGIAFPDAESGTAGVKLHRPLVRLLLWPVLAGSTYLVLRVFGPS